MLPHRYLGSKLASFQWLPGQFPDQRCLTERAGWSPRAHGNGMTAGWRDGIESGTIPGKASVFCEE